MSKQILFFLIIILSIILGLRTSDYYKTIPVYQDSQQVRVVVTVREEPEIISGRQKVKVKTEEGFRVTILTQAAPMYQSGDKLLLDGVFTKKHFEDVDYWTSYFPNLQSVKNDHNIVTGMAKFIRIKAKNLFESTLPPVSSSLLLGIVLGGKQGMPKDFLEKLQTVGVLHVIAASGMNVSFVAMFLVAVLGNVMKRQLALFTAILGIAFYVTVAGFEPSIVRAAVMSTLALIASLLGRQSAVVLTLVLTGYVMLVVSPGLWEDVGFQLSFLATLGILTVKPVLGGLGKLGRVGRWIGEDVTTTTAAQIATLPILLGVFGSYGLLSVLVNGLILWTVPVLMTLGSLGIVGGLIFEPVGKVFLLLSYPFLWFFEAVINLFGSAGWMLTIPKMSPVVWVGYYCLLGAFVMRNMKQESRSKEKNLIVNLDS